jgi:peroxiredoxin
MPAKEGLTMPKSGKFWVLVAGLLLAMCLIACVAFMLISGLGPLAYGVLSSDLAVGVGRQAPEFELTTLSGESIRLSQFRGRPVLLSFSASWCPGCREEAPILQAVHERHPDLAVLLVDYQEDAATAQAFAKKYGMTFPVALDTAGEVSDDYRIYAIPSVFLIDGQGVICNRFPGQFTEGLVDEALGALAGGED